MLLIKQYMFSSCYNIPFFLTETLQYFGLIGAGIVLLFTQWFDGAFLHPSVAPLSPPVTQQVWIFFFMEHERVAQAFTSSQEE